MWTELAKLHQTLATTTVYVTHDQVEAMTLGHWITVMNDGVIQEADTPLALYPKPINQFVAGFIGSPAINFTRGEVTDSEFRSGSLRLNVGNVNHAGEAVLGIRPEDLIHATDNMDPLFTATIEVVERMGHETVIYFQLNWESMVARIDDDIAASPGDNLSFSIKERRLHLFDAGPDGGRIECSMKKESA